MRRTETNNDARSVPSIVIVFGFALAVFIAAGCTTREASSLHPLTVAAASDLRFALDETIRQFKPSNTDIDLKTVYGSSGNFYTQISNAAPFDLFMSADMEYPRKLVQEGFAIEGTEFEYAVGRLVLWVRKDSPLDVERLGMDAVTDPRVRKFSIANPQHAPYGRTAVAAMQKFGVYERIADRLVFGENVSQALQFIHGWCC
jgi:molybdate transport system substrate-binding protein